LQSLTEPDEVEPRFTTTENAQLTPEERRVLRALANPEYRLRTTAGVAAEADIAMENITRILNGLKMKNFTDSTTIIVRGKEKEGFRWFITPMGRKAIEQILAGTENHST
jgi:DNA-binding MarR family transcriptional regulator